LGEDDRRLLYGNLRELKEVVCVCSKSKVRTERERVDGDRCGGREGANPRALEGARLHTSKSGAGANT
jgi:hypothetical protein